MPYLRPLAHVSFALVGDRPVFLDIARDRYLALEGECALTFRELCAAERPLCAAAADRLLATRLFERVDGPLPILPAQATAAEHQLDLTDWGSRIRDRLGVWRALGRVGRELRSTPLQTVLARRRPLRTGGQQDDPESAARLAGRFRRARAGVPVAPRCLPDSLALWDWLHARQVAASIVFGVKLDPFSAHCWVQHGTLALNEALDRAAEYTPIFVFP